MLTPGWDSVGLWPSLAAQSGAQRDLGQSITTKLADAQSRLRIWRDTIICGGSSLELQVRIAVQGEALVDMLELAAGDERELLEDLIRQTLELAIENDRALDSSSD